MEKQKEAIYQLSDILDMLDGLFRDEGKWWDRFYSDRAKPVPFFVNSPDENLVEYFDHLPLHGGKVLELGCGAGRNAIFMAGQHCTVDAVDLSQEAIDWGKERIRESGGMQINFVCKNIFELDIMPESYDFVYDSGCFHHLLPHRRIGFAERILHALKPGGYFGLVCFAAGSMGAEITDWEVYRERSLKGGLGYTEDKIRAIFEAFELIEFRRMKSLEQTDERFGRDFLWTVLFRKKIGADVLPAERSHGID